MLVDLRPLRRERGARLVVTCGCAIDSHIPDVPFSEPVEGTLTLTNLGSILRIEGRLQTPVEVVCDRCATPFRHSLVAPVAEDLAWPDDEVVLDLAPLAREMLLLAMPMVLRCQEDCPGLCGICGADLREGPCGCAEGATGEPVE